MQPQPLVSICIPARNAAPYVDQTIRSVIAQSWQAWELIIVENCSTDGTRQVVESAVHGLADPRIRLHLNEQPLGMAENWNRAVTLGRGEFVKVLSADDLLAPSCVEWQAGALQAHPGVAVVAGARRIINAQGRRLFIRAAIKREGLHEGRKMIRRCLRSGSNLIGDPAAVMFRRETLQRTGLFDPAIVYYTDYELWLRLLAEGDFYCLPQVCSDYRIHSGATATQVRGKMLEDYFRMVDCCIRAGTFSLSGAGRAFLREKVRLLNWLRQEIYRRRGG